ncbi:MAG: hypothetical protein AB2813_01640 [Candidatus Sedimenticola endophacoides]
MSITLEDAKVFSVAEMTGLPAKDLMQLQAAAGKALQKAKDLKDWIDGAIALKYEVQTNALRAQISKDTGTVHFDDDGVRVTTNLPKKPVWDQKKLSEIARRITASGDDPSEYLDITYKVAERKYTAWPESLRESFAPARTLKTGKATFQLIPIEE